MITQLITQGPSRIPLIVLISICCGAALTIAQAQNQAPARHGTQYRVSNLDTLGGTSSGGNSINNRSWVAGYSRLTGDQSRHAALWRNRHATCVARSRYPRRTKQQCHMEREKYRRHHCGHFPDCRSGAAWGSLEQRGLL